MTESKLHITLFGAPTIAEERVTGKHALLLAYLVLDTRDWIAKDELIEHLWPGEYPKRAKDLSNLLSDLGHRDTFVTHRRDPRVEIVRSNIEVDTTTAIGLVEEAGDAFARGDGEATIGHAREAAELAEPGLLCGEEAGWLDGYRRDFEERFQEALKLAVLAALNVGAPWLEDARADAMTLRVRGHESGYWLGMLIAMACGEYKQAEDIDADLIDFLGDTPASAATVKIRAGLYAGREARAADPAKRPGSGARQPPPPGSLSSRSVDPDDRSDLYCDLARHNGPLMGQQHVQTRIARVTAEMANIGWAICYALEHGRPVGIEAALALKDHCWYRSFSLAVITDMALARSIEDPKHGQVVNMAGLDAIVRGDLDAARMLFEYGLEFGGPAHDHPTEALCTLGLAELELRRFAYDLASGRFQEARERFGALHDLLGEANCLLGLALAAMWRGDHDAVCRDLDAAILLYKRAGDPLGEANCTRALAEVALARGDGVRARSRVERAFKVYVDIGHLLGQASALRVFAALSTRTGELAPARRQLEQALKTNCRIANTLGRANRHVDLGDVALAAAQPSMAREQYARAEPLYSDRGCVRGCVEIANRLAALAIEQGEPGRAREELDRALALGRQAEDPHSWARTHVYRAQLGGPDVESHIATARDALMGAGFEELARSLAPGCDAPPPRRIPDDNA